MIEASQFPSGARATRKPEIARTICPTTGVVNSREDAELPRIRRPDQWSVPFATWSSGAPISTNPDAFRWARQVW